MMYVVVLLNSLVYLTNCIGIEVEIGLLVMLLLQFTLFVGVCWRVLCLAIVGRDLTFLKRKKEREEGENHYNLSIGDDRHGTRDVHARRFIHECPNVKSPMAVPKGTVCNCNWIFHAVLSYYTRKNT